MHPDHVINRASWDELAAVHGQDRYYDTDALVMGASSLIAEEESALAAAVGHDLTGLSVLHVQCHIGFDTITFARRRARVTGVDFSAVALAKACSIAERCGVEVEWVCADMCELPDELHGRFDLAWATIGVLCWIADLDAWMRSVAGTLVPGGRLVLVDGVWPPNGGGERNEYPEGGDYASDTTTGPQVLYDYAPPDVLAAAANAGVEVLESIELTELTTNFGHGDPARARRPLPPPHRRCATVAAASPARAARSVDGWARS
jgi:SAM-dependent methyltransferase